MSLLPVRKLFSTSTSLETILKFDWRECHLKTKNNKELNKGKRHTSFLEERQLLVANDGCADRTSDKHLHSPTRRNAAILVSLRIIGNHAISMETYNDSSDWSLCKTRAISTNQKFY